MKNKIVTLLLMTFLLGAMFLPVVNGQIQETKYENNLEVYKNEKKAKIVTKTNGVNGLVKTSRQIKVENVEKIKTKFKRLTKAVEKDNENQALSIAHNLKKQGVFKTDKIFDLIKNKDKPKKLISENLTEKLNLLQQSSVSNIMSFVSGYSDEGYFGYPLDAVFIPFGFFLLNLFDVENPFALLAVIGGSMLVTHLIPFRLLLPAMAFYFYSGQMTTTGFKGTKNLEKGTMFGFAGIAVNIYTPNKTPSAFCIGFSPVVDDYFPIE